MSGAYRYKRVQVIGDERYHDVPDKNMASHVCEAEQYRLLGHGEGRTVLKGHRINLPRPELAIM